MKREKATKEEKKLIKEWLLQDCNDAMMACPFKGLVKCYDLHSYCKRYFPQKNSPYCPCYEYSMQYVRRVAKELKNA